MPKYEIVGRVTATVKSALLVEADSPEEAVKIFLADHTIGYDVDDFAKDFEATGVMAEDGTFTDID